MASNSPISSGMHSLLYRRTQTRMDYTASELEGCYGPETFGPEESLANSSDLGIGLHKTGVI